MLVPRATAQILAERPRGLLHLLQEWAKPLWGVALPLHVVFLSLMGCCLLEKAPSGMN